MSVKLLLGDYSERLPELDDESVDMVLTSPPYDDMDEDFNPIQKNGLRKYNGYSWDFKKLAHELFRVLKQGGVLVWVVNDPTIKGSESLASCLQKIYFRRVGFNIHDTMIYEKDNFQKPDDTRYWAGFEYVFILSKGKPKVTKFIKDRKNKKGGKLVTGKTIRNSNGTMSKRKDVAIAQFGKRTNIWTYNVGYMKVTSDKSAYKHPAIFPEKFAEDHILSWSNLDNVILDPMMGSGTTGKMALKNGRNFIGIELSREYFDIAKKRIKDIQSSACFL